MVKKHKPTKSADSHKVTPAKHDKQSHAMPAKLKAALETEKKIEAEAEKAARQAIINGTNKSTTGAAASSPIVTPSAITNPHFKHGVGEAIVSTGKVQAPPHIRRMRALMVTLIVLLVVSTVAWAVLERKHYRELHTPQRQAELFDKYDELASSLEISRRYESEVAVLQSYLNDKPDSPYRDKAILKLAGAYVNNRQYDQAIAQYKLIENVSTVQLDAWRGLAVAYGAKGDKKQSVAYLQKVTDNLKSKNDAISRLQSSIDQTKLDAAKQ